MGLSGRQLGGEEGGGGHLELCTCWRTIPTWVSEAATDRERTQHWTGGEAVAWPRWWHPRQWRKRQTCLKTTLDCEEPRRASVRGWTVPTMPGKNCGKNVPSRETSIMSRHSISMNSSVSQATSNHYNSKHSTSNNSFTGNFTPTTFSKRKLRLQQLPQSAPFQDFFPFPLPASPSHQDLLSQS
jgi:hypothetical protein